MRFKIDIGDWSEDGHSKKRTFIVECNASDIESVRECYFSTRYKYPELDPCGFAYGFEDNTVPESVLSIYREVFGKDLELDAGTLSPEIMAQFTVDFLNLGNPHLGAVLLADETTPSFHFYGYDANRRHINSIGYGLYSF